MLGLNPLEFSYRELMAMLEGQRKETWNYWSQLMCLLHNCWAQKAAKPDDYNPTKLPQFGIPSTAVSAAKSAWLGGNQ